jgi:Leucine-rich repeat (LRR) protein
LSGPIPPELGKLSDLRYLLIRRNSLSGGVPSELGSLTKLRYLTISDNEGLSGPLPPSLEGLPLTFFWYHNTGLCVPLEASFRAWLAGIEDHSGTGVDCTSDVVAVCDRTPQVRDAIVAAAGRTSCQEVTDEDLAAIRHLRLSSEGITSLKSGDFGGMSGLQELFLHRNRLETLPSRVFEGLSALEELHLQSNDLGAFPAQVLDLTTLKTLWLFGNEFPPGPLPVELSKLSNMEDLHLGNLNVTEIAAGTFNTMENLRRLDLRHNDLSELPEGVFEGLSSLSNLNLWSNRLTKLPTAAFRGTPGFRLLHLHDNRGSPFELTLAPRQVGASSSTESTLSVEIAEAAPFDIEVPLRTSADGSLSSSSVTIQAGATVSGQVVVKRVSGSCCPSRTRWIPSRRSAHSARCSTHA